VGTSVRKKVAVLSDFDGTVVLCNTIKEIYRRFAGPLCQSYVDRWRRREISAQQELQGCFSTITATRAEMEAFLDTIPLAPGFAPFVCFCEQRHYPLVIASEGLRWAIEHILSRHGIVPQRVFANEIHFEAAGLRLSFPWHDPADPMSGVAKGAVVRRYQEAGSRVVYIGDGQTDEAAARVADWVFARAALLDYCRRHGIEAIPFDSFDDIRTAWPLP
jgi:2,3-diketo-5-methylthio-1-phosphopentane phosphatase